MTERPEVSFVVPSYRSRSTLGATLDSIRRQHTCRCCETLVVDSSAEGTAEWINAAYPDIRIITSPSRLRPGEARNLGAGRARGSYLAFLDADARAEPNWLETLHRRLNHDASVQLTGGWVANANPSSIASRVLHWIEFSQFLPGQTAAPRQSLSSSNLLIRREDFLKAGGFDPTFAMAEDLIFCRKFAARIYFEGSTGIRHFHRSQWGQVSSHLTRLGYWSGRYRREYPGRGSWLTRIPRLSFLLPFYRGPRILFRVWRTDWKEGLHCLFLLPAVTAGLFAWSGGFCRGITRINLNRE
ncbi:MAG: glycosyltransferase family 2 protein [Acidobacteriota bacterium]